MLFVSSGGGDPVGQLIATAFQSRNRDAFRFKQFIGVDISAEYMFQSRNRDAFRFKEQVYNFNVVADDGFQSRNRDAFRFK